MDSDDLEPHMEGLPLCSYGMTVGFVGWLLGGAVTLDTTGWAAILGIWWRELSERNVSKLQPVSSFGNGKSLIYIEPTFGFERLVTQDDQALHTASKRRNTDHAGDVPISDLLGKLNGLRTLWCMMFQQWTLPSNCTSSKMESVCLQACTQCLLQGFRFVSHRPCIAKAIAVVGEAAAELFEPYYDHILSLGSRLCIIKGIVCYQMIYGTTVDLLYNYWISKNIRCLKFGKTDPLIVSLSSWAVRTLILRQHIDTTNL